MAMGKSEGSAPLGPVREVPADRLRADPAVPGHERDEESDRALAETVAKDGVRKPLICRADADGALLAIAGRGRLEAARAAGLETVPSYVLGNVPDEDARSIARYSDIFTSGLKLTERSRMCYELIGEISRWKSTAPWWDPDWTPPRQACTAITGMTVGTFNRTRRCTDLAERLHPFLDDERYSGFIRNAEKLVRWSIEDQERVAGVLEAGITTDVLQAMRMVRGSTVGLQAVHNAVALVENDCGHGAVPNAPELAQAVCDLARCAGPDGLFASLTALADSAADEFAADPLESRKAIMKAIGTLTTAVVKADSEIRTADAS